MGRFTWRGLLAVFAFTAVAFQQQQHVNAKKDLPPATTAGGGGGGRPATPPASEPPPAAAYRPKDQTEEPIIEEVTAKQLERVLNEKDYVAVFWCE